MRNSHLEKAGLLGAVLVISSILKWEPIGAFLSAIGAGFLINDRFLGAFLVAFLLVGALGHWLSFRRHCAMTPLLIHLGGAVLVLIFLFVSSIRPLALAGALALFAAAVWDFVLQRRLKTRHGGLILEKANHARWEALEARLKILNRIASQRGSRVITMMHRREPWDHGNETPSIVIEDTETVLSEIRATQPATPIDLILHTPGGLGLAVEMIAIALKAHPGKVTVLVPFYAMSGGTLIALAADEIIMEEYSVLGPVDPQIAGFPSATLLRLLQRKPIRYIADETLILADIARLAIEQTCGFVRWLLEDRMEIEQRDVVAEFLVNGYLLHSSPITLALCKSLGLPVRHGVPDEVYELFKTYYQGSCLRPGLSPFSPNVAASRRSSVAP